MPHRYVTMRVAILNYWIPYICFNFLSSICFVLRLVWGIQFVANVLRFVFSIVSPCNNASCLNSFYISSCVAFSWDLKWFFLSIARELGYVWSIFFRRTLYQIRNRRKNWRNIHIVSHANIKSNFHDVRVWI